jgi:hypothetical protein
MINNSAEFITPVWDINPKTIFIFIFISRSRISSLRYIHVCRASGASRRPESQSDASQAHREVRCNALLIGKSITETPVSLSDALLRGN